MLLLHIYMVTISVQFNYIWSDVDTSKLSVVNRDISEERAVLDEIDWFGVVGRVTGSVFAVWPEHSGTALG